MPGSCSYLYCLIKAARSAFHILYMYLLGGTLSVAIAAGVPGGITPGGAMPQIQEKPEPFVYPNIEKPAMPERKVIDDDPAAPRMLLKGFELYGIKDRPQYDISLEKIQRLIAAETEAMLPPGGERLFTISMFEQIAVAITRYYRARGFFLARAYIPEQKVTNGIVKLQVVETYLDQIVFDGNTLYDDETMAILFEDLIGEPVYITDIEAAMFKLNDYPGLTASAVFGPGSEPGSAAIVMRAFEKSYENRISLDNYGSAFTGENRVLFHHDSNNLFGNADLLAINAMTSFSPANNQYVDFTYVQPVFKSLFKVGGGLAYNQFTVGEELEDLDINGDSIILKGFIDYRAVHTRTDSFNIIADLSLKQATSRVVDTVQAKDKLTVVRLDTVYSGIDRLLWTASHEAYFSVSVGLADFLGSMDSTGNGMSSRRGGSGATATTAGTRAGGDFTKFNFGYSRLQPTFNLQSLLFRFDMQVSSDLLTSLEQYSMGGPYNVRAYPVAEILVDNAMFASFEYIFTASPEIRQTWLNKLQLSVFFDYATGDLNDPILNSVSEATLSGVGIGIQAVPFDKVKARIDFARATGDEPSDLQSLPFYFSLEYVF